MNIIRRIIIGVFGIILIIDALVQSFEPLQFIIGLIMVGLVPVDILIDIMIRPAHDENELERLREVMQYKDDDPPIEG
jgi:hypothetical protein